MHDGSAEKDTKEAALLEVARARFKLAEEAESRQRVQEREDLRFQVPEEQWDEAARAARKGDALSPARPMLSITQLDAPVKLTRNRARAAKLGVNVHPISEEADDDTAEVIQGLYRRIERDSNASVARMWALDRALKAGRGFYRVVTRYDEDSPETFDQEIGIERILYQESVYLDPAAQQPDWSDGEFAFVSVWVPMEAFKRQFPSAKFAQVSSPVQWEAERSSAPEWVRGGYGDDGAVLLAEYWFKEHAVTTIEVSVGGEVQKREKDDVSVYVCKLVGDEVVEGPVRWNGRYIPIIPVLGQELQPFDQRRRFAGMITNAKDGQRLYNYAASTLVEGMALEPKAPFVGMEGQFEGHEDQWVQANTRNFPYLEYRNVTLDGKPAPPPQRAQVDGTRMNLAVMALQQADRFIQTVTAVQDPSLGRLPQERSGRAILALQGQSDDATGDYISNLAEIAMAYEARVILDLMPAIYDRPGRITRILRGDDAKAEKVALNAPFVGKGGDVRVLPQPMKGSKIFDFRKGRYGISIDVGKSYKSRLQEGDEALTQLVTAKPELLPIVGDIWFQYRDQPGAKEISKRLARWREMQMPGLGEGEDGQPSPEQAEMKVRGLEQQVQQLQQQLQQAAQAIQTDQAKQQAAMMKAQADQQTALAKTEMDAASRERIAASANETKLTIAAADNQTKLAIAGLEERLAAMEMILREIGAERQMLASASESRESRGHEAAMAAAAPSKAPQGAGGQV